MKLLEDRILKDGNVLGENILKVDSFLTHQVDFNLMREIGKIFAESSRMPASLRWGRLRHLVLHQPSMLPKPWMSL